MNEYDPRIVVIKFKMLNIINPGFQKFKKNAENSKTQKQTKYLKQCIGEAGFQEYHSGLQYKKCRVKGCFCRNYWDEDQFESGQ